jgi:hypothetical protein
MLNIGTFLRTLKYTFLLLTFITATSIGQSTFYISTSTGNDSNDGLSESSPWKTLEKLHNSWNQIGPGDQILFKRGDTWAPSYSNLDRIGIIRIPNLKKGTSGNPIILGAYGTGSNPILSDENVSGYHQLLRSGAMEYIEFHDLHFKGQILLRANESVEMGLNYIGFYNCIIENYSPILYKGFTGPQSLIPASNVDNWAKISNITFKYCKFYNCNGNGGTINFGPYENCYIGYCEFYNCQEEAIDLSGGTGNVIEYNIISGTTVNGIKLHSQYCLFKDGIIRGNLIIHSGNGTTGGAGLGMQNVQNCKVYNNTIFAPMYAAMFGNRDRLPPEGYFGNFENNEIRNNLFYGMIQITGSWENVTLSGVPMPYKNMENSLFEDNIFSNNTYWTGHTGNYIFRFWKNDGYPNQYNDYVYKDIYKNNQSDFATHWSNKTDVSEKMRDPNFTNPNWNNANNYGSYELNSSSNEINSGYLITDYNQDLAGNIVPQGGISDRGAYEFNESDFTPPMVVSANIINTSTVEVNFSERIDATTAENSANYSITGGISVLNSSLSSSSTKVTLTTSSHSTSTYTVTVNNIEDYSGNVISSNNTAQYTFNADSIPPEVVSAEITSPTIVVVSFSEEMDQTSVENISNYSISNGISVTNAVLSANETEITLTTSEHSSGDYIVTVTNVADKSGNIITASNTAAYSFINDSVPPILVSALLLDNITIEVNFNEPLDNNTAVNTNNYSISNGINVNNAIIDSGGIKVTLITSAHTAGDYTVTVSNVTDIAGNIISTNNSAQYSYITDFTPPEIQGAAILASNTIKVYFSEPLDPTTAVNFQNYNIDNGISISNAVLDSGSIVTLTTSPHPTGNYLLTVTNIKDTANNVISGNNTAEYSYTADTIPPELVSVQILGISSVKADFSEVLDEISAQNENNYNINNGIEILNAALSTDGKSVLLTTSDHSSGSYVLTISSVKDLGGNNIGSQNSAQYSFNSDIEPPEVSGAEIINATTIRISFSESIDQITGVIHTNYLINNGIDVIGIEILPPGYEVILSTSDHPPGTYDVTVSNVKDLSGNVIAGNNTASYSYDPDLVSPTLIFALSTDRNTIELAFSEDVSQETSENIQNYTITNNIAVIAATRSQSGEKVTLITEELQTGENYTLFINNIEDLSGNKISTNTSASLYCFANNLTPIALYDFTKGPDSNIVYDVSCKGSPLNLNISDPSAVTWLDGGGLLVSGSTIISSQTAASKITDRCKSRNAITIEAWIKTANLLQNGPARIVTLSSGTSDRNFTFGQGTATSTEGYDVRLRTTSTNNNGIPSLTSTPQSLTTELTHFVYTRESNGDTKIFINGVENMYANIDGNLTNWNDNYKLTFANEFSGDRPWQGELYRIAIYDYALSEESIITSIDNYNNSQYADIKIYLEGPYSDGAMSTLLQSMNIIPMTQPYSEQPWNYNGQEVTTSIPDNIVDWVLVELRNIDSVTVAKRAAFLRNDGYVVDLNGISRVSFCDIAPGDYYIVVNHRNHIPVMSAGLVNISKHSILYDFTISVNNTNGESGIADLGNGVFGMYAGDTNSSDMITYSDVMGIIQKNTSSGYLPADANLTGIITYADITPVVNNNTRVSQVPEVK